jgi:hypothetical protein
MGLTGVTRLTPIGKAMPRSFVEMPRAALPKETVDAADARADRQRAGALGT